MKLSTDPEIAHILAEPEGDTPQDHLELLTVLSGQIFLAGRSFPAPTFGTYALLQMIRSPFLRTNGPPPTAEDLIHALFLLSEPQKGIRLLWNRVRCENVYSTLERQNGIHSDADRRNLKQAIRRERQFRNLWRRETEIFRRKTNLPSEDSAISELAHCLQPGIGFSMIPPGASAAKPQIVNLEPIIQAAAGLTAALPSLTLDQLLWKIPVAAVGFLTVQTARRSGIRGVSRDETSEKLWKRFQVLQKQPNSTEPAENALPEKQNKVLKKIRNRLQRIRSASDLRSTKNPCRSNESGPGLSVPTGNSVEGCNNPGFPERTSQIPAGMSYPAPSVRMETPIPVPFPAAAADPAAGFDALRTLQESVKHIENILKQQLPEGIV